MQGIVHYNAFISYRHTLRDSLVAAHLQKALETYRIPRQIRKSLGIKPIHSIFRDTEELEATSDLRATIASALAASDYLIVICSPDTASSEWVAWEIDTFLRTHDSSKVLTVIAAGDPAAVIPGRLRREGLEPLACNYTGPIKAADKIELPRLIATILGCSYAALMQRQRLYALRRLSLIGCGALFLLLFLSIYMAASRAAIHKSYQEALRNQAKSLASESQDMLSGYDFVTATSLALAALPSQDKPDIPVTSQAQSALTEAVSAYHVNELALAYTFTAKDTIRDYRFSSSGNYLLAMDDSNYFTVWDCQLGEEIYSSKIIVESALAGFLPLGAESAILWNGSSVSCLNYVENVTLWEIQFSASDITCRLSEDNSCLFLAGNDDLFFIDTKTGGILSTATLQEKEYQALASSPAVFIDDSSVLFFAQSWGEPGETKEEAAPIRLVLWEAARHKITVLPKTFQNPVALRLTGEKEVALVLSWTGETPSGPEEGSTLLYPAPGLLTAFSLKEEEVLWEQEMAGTTYQNEPVLLPLTYQRDEELRAGIVAAYSNLSCLYDLETGALISQAPLKGSVLNVLTSSPDQITYISDNGNMIIHSFQDGTSRVQATLSSSVTMARSLLEEGPLLLPKMALRSGGDLLYYAHISDHSAVRELFTDHAPFLDMVHTSGGAVFLNADGTSLTFFLPGTSQRATVDEISLLPEEKEEVVQKDTETGDGQGVIEEGIAEKEQDYDEEEEEVAEKEQEGEDEEGTSPQSYENADFYLVGAEEDLSYAYCLASLPDLTNRLLRVSPSEVTDLGELGGVTTDFLMGARQLPFTDFTDGVLTLCDMEMRSLYQRNVYTGEEFFIPLQGLSDSQELLYLYFDKGEQSSYLIPSPVILSPQGNKAFVSIYDEDYDCCFGALVDVTTGVCHVLEAAEDYFPDPAEYLATAGDASFAEEEEVSALDLWAHYYPLSDIDIQMVFSDNGSYLALLYSSTILLWTSEGQFLGEIPPSSTADIDFAFYESALLVVSANTLTRYSISGDILSATRLLKGHGTSSVSPLSPSQNRFEYVGDYLLLSQGGQMYILNADLWEESSLGTVGGYLFYDSGQNRFYTYDATRKSITSYIWHDLEELILMGRIRLGSNEMDETLKLSFALP